MIKNISKLTKDDIQNIKLIVLDVDGVLVPRGTIIEQDGNETYYETKRISDKNINLIKSLYDRGFLINISSGRSLTMLMDMFRDILPYVSLTYENGSATWISGKVYQHLNSFEHIYPLYKILGAIKHKNIKGWEPKEHIITIHCEDRVKKIEDIMEPIENMYCIWNKEAYDIGMKEKQTKGNGLKYLMYLNRLASRNVLAIGDNLNDKELIDVAGVRITADKTRLDGDFWIDLEGKELPATILMKKLLML